MNGSEPALFWSTGKLSFSELEEAVNGAASRLVAAGVEPQDRVVVFALPAHLDLIFFLALAKIGAVSLTARAVSSTLTSLFEWQVVFGRPEIESIIPGSKLIVADESWIQGPQDGAPVVPYEFTDDEPCRILSTSGTTGKEKLAVYGHQALDRKMRDNSKHWVSELVEFNIMPAGSIGGIYTALNLMFRAMPYFVFDGKDPQLLNFLIGSKVEGLSGSPYQVAGLITTLEKTNLKLKNLKRIRLAGAITSERLRNYILSQYPVEISAVYGSTECGGVFTKDITKSSNLSDLGQLLEGAEITVSDEGGLPVGNGQVGSLGCKTDSMYLGYLQPDGSLLRENTSRWFFPGDLVVMGQNSVTFVGRDSDILNVGGVKIDATAIDEFARNFETVADALSFEAEDISGKPVLALAVVPRQGFDMAMLVEGLNRNFPNSAPQILGEVKAIPRTELGKPQRAALAKVFSASAR
jgi:long-chain acyl-CoA synthetase